MSETQSTPASEGLEATPAGRDPVLLRVDDGVATLTFNRPAQMNSLDVATKVALRDTLAQVGHDASVRCVVLTGSGRAFCVGQDLNEHVDLLAAGDDDALFATVAEHYNPIVTSILTMAKPVVAAVNGVAAGAGASIALACDYRLVAHSAGFNFAFTGIGLSCDTGASWTLPRLVGRAKAIELLFDPRTINAEEAAALGLATRTVATDDLAGEAAALAAQLAAGPTVAYAAIRRAVTHSATAELADALALEGELMTLTGSTEDHRRAVESFLAKEQPRFEGR